MNIVITITREDALANGFTHEGSLYGIPVWFQDVDSDTPVCAPKLYLLTPYCMFMDALFGFVAGVFMREDQYLRTPMTIKGRIPK